MKIIIDSLTFIQKDLNYISIVSKVWGWGYCLLGRLGDVAFTFRGKTINYKFEEKKLLQPLKLEILQNHIV